MKKLNNKGQVVVGLVLLVGIVALILINNLQTQQIFLARQILETRSKIELENAIDLFGKELYKSYVLSAVIPQSIDSARRNPVSTTDPTSGLEFSIEGNKICSVRQVRTGVNVPICITLPGNFAKLLIERNNLTDKTSTNYAKMEFLKFFTKVLPAEAQLNKNFYGEPDPSAAPVATLTRNFNSDFVKIYSRYECLTVSPDLKCLKIKFCVRPSGCPATDDSDKVLETFIFTLVPKTQMRE